MNHSQHSASFKLLQAIKLSNVTKINNKNWHQQAKPLHAPSEVAMVSRAVKPPELTKNPLLACDDLQKGHKSNIISFFRQLKKAKKSTFYHFFNFFSKFKFHPKSKTGQNGDTKQKRRLAVVNKFQILKYHLNIKL